MTARSVGRPERASAMRALLARLLLLLAAPAPALGLAGAAPALAEMDYDVIPTAFAFPDFLNRPMLNMNGDATTQFKDLAVAGPGFDKVGSVFFATPFDLSKGFYTEFTFSVSQVEVRTRARGLLKRRH